MIERNKLADLIRRFREGKASEEEKYQLEQFWQEALRDTAHVDSLSEDERKALQGEILGKIKSKIRNKELKPVVKTTHSWFWPAAATVALIAIGALLYLNINRIIEKRTDYGERKAIELPDKSMVTLNGNSSLKYKTAWKEGTKREVWIEGEGFFSVQHTGSHQEFVVYALDGVSAEVLGTKFNVKSRGSGTEVLLTEGKIKIKLSNNTETSHAFLLAPGELGAVDNHRLSRRVVSRRQYTSWLTDTLVFDHTPLGEISLMLEDVYGLNVVFSDTVLQDRQLSGDISSVGIDDLLFAIAETFELEVDRRGDRVYIAPKE